MVGKSWRETGGGTKLAGTYGGKRVAGTYGGKELAEHMAGNGWRKHMAGKRSRGKRVARKNIIVMKNKSVILYRAKKM